MNTINDAINRGFNLLAASITGLSGFAFAPEIFLENDMIDKVDDALILLLGLAGIAWYCMGNNKYTRSIVPVVFVALAFIVKTFGVWVEHGDPDAVGDDMGGHILFLLALILVGYQYWKNGKLLKSQQ